VRDMDINIQKVSFRKPLEYFKNISGRLIMLNIIMNIELNIPTHAYKDANGTYDSDDDDIIITTGERVS
jgi:hypothetical protein